MPDRMAFPCVYTQINAKRVLGDAVTTVHVEITCYFLFNLTMNGADRGSE